MNIKFNKGRFYLAVLLQVTLITGFYSCSEKITQEETFISNKIAAGNQLKAASLVNSQTTVPTIASATLFAGQTINVGNLVINEVDTNADGINDALAVTYNLTGGWLFKEIHLWIGSDLAAMPRNKGGNPVVGNFPYKPADSAGKSVYTVTVPFSAIGYTTCSAVYYVAAHASVYNGTNSQTAWSTGTTINPKGQWGTYTTIEVADRTAASITGSIDVVDVEGCSASSAPAALTTVAALEALGLSIADARTTDANLVVTSADVVTGSCPIEVLRTYTITDGCGNNNSVTQTIHVHDLTAPVLSGQGANATITSPAVPSFTAPTATDNCDQNPVVSASVDVVGSVTVAGITSTTITRTWSAIDACGNVSVTVSQTITVNPAPVVTPPVTPVTPPVTPPSAPVSYTTDTAFGGNASGAGNAWWYYYDGVGVETIWAGQYKNAGTVEKIGGNLVITLANGFELQPVTESVKIQGYTTLPSGRPAAGQFTTYKGTSLTVPVGSFPYYVVHLDVRKAN